MDGYRPPWTPLPMRPVLIPVQPLTGLPESFALGMDAIPVWDTAGRPVSVYCTIADMISYTCLRTYKSLENPVTPDMVEALYRDAIGLEHGDWPASLAEAIYQLAGRWLIDPSGTASVCGGDGEAGGDDTPRRILSTDGCIGREVARAVAILKLHLYRGYPLGVGFRVSGRGDEYLGPPPGRIVLTPYDPTSVDGRAILIYGWDDRLQVFRCRPHLGTAWGDGGSGVIRYDDVMRSDMTYEVVALDW